MIAFIVYRKCKNNGSKNKIYADRSKQKEDGKDHRRSRSDDSEKSIIKDGRIPGMMYSGEKKVDIGGKGKLEVNVGHAVKNVNASGPESGDVFERACHDLWG